MNPPIERNDEAAAVIETFFECFTTVLTRSERPAFVDEVREALRPRLCDGHGGWTADYVLLRFAARRP